MNILGVAEMRWASKGKIVKQGCKVIWSGSCKDEHDVSFLLDNKAAKGYMGHWVVSDRIILLDLGFRVNLSIVQEHVSTKYSPD